MGQYYNFKITIRDEFGKKKVIGLSAGSVVIQQREQMQQYSDERLKVSLIVMPSRRLEMRARMCNEFVDTTHAMIKQTDPVKDPSDWLTRTDDKIVFKKKPRKYIERRHQISKKRGMK